MTARRADSAHSLARPQQTRRPGTTRQNHAATTQKFAAHASRIFLVEDHPVLRQGLMAIINTQPDLVVCGEAEDRQQALALLTARVPDLAIVDLMLKDSDGLELIKDMQVSCPQVAILVFSMHREWVYAERVLRAGAQGYLNKQEAGPRLLEAIRCILAGQVYLSSQMAYHLATKVIGHPLANGASLSGISDRELQVLQSIGTGRSTRTTAENLHLHLKTVETYRARLKEKLGLKNAAELLQFAIGWSRQEEAGAAAKITGV